MLKKIVIVTCICIVVTLSFISTLSASPIVPRKNKVSTNIAVFPEIQMHYGLYNNFYHHGHWNDHPLYMNRHLRYAGTKYQPQTFINIKEELQLLHLGKYDGFSPLGSAKQIANIIKVCEEEGGNLKVLPAVYAPVVKSGGDYKKSVANFHDVIKFASSPAVYKINGKMVINSYEANLLKPQQYKELLYDARKQYGDTFYFVASLVSQVQRYAYRSKFLYNGGKINPKELEEFKAKLQEYLDVCDGIQIAPHAMDDPSHLDKKLPKKFTEHIVDVVREVMNRPQNRRKLLSAICYNGYTNPLSGKNNQRERGMQLVASSMEAALALDPDYIVPFEWNEWNENTSFMPTIKKGNAIGRLMNYYRSFFPNENAAKPLKGDDLSVPNMILSYRFALQKGNLLEMELLNVPDNSFKYEYDAILELTTLNGKRVKKFPKTTFNGAQLKSQYYTFASEEFKNFELIPRLQISLKDNKKLIYSHFPPIQFFLFPPKDQMFYRLPLREIGSGTIKFEVKKIDKEYFHLQGEIKSNDLINSVELLSNHQVYRAIEKNPQFNLDKDLIIRAYASSCNWKQLTGYLQIKDASLIAGRALQIDGNHHYVKDYTPIINGIKMNIDSGGHGTRGFFLVIPKKEALKATLEGNFSAGKFSISVKELMKYGTMAKELPGAIFWRFDCIERSIDIPYPIVDKEIKFNFKLKNTHDNPLFYLRIATMNGKRFFSKSIAPKLHDYSHKVYVPLWSEDKKSPVKVEIPSDIAIEAKYDFNPAIGQVLLVPGNPDFTGELGGGYHYCQPNYRRTQMAKNKPESCAPQWIVNPGEKPFLRFNGIYDNITFYPGVMPLGAFKIGCEIRINEPKDMILLRHSQGGQQSSVSIFIYKGNLAIGHVKSSGKFTLFETGLPIKLNQWQKIIICYDLEKISAQVDSSTWSTNYSGIGRTNSSMIFGGDQNRDFLPQPKMGYFQGDLRSLLIGIPRK